MIKMWFDWIFTGISQQLVKAYISHKALRQDGLTHPLLTTTDSPCEALSVGLVASLPPRSQSWKHAILRSEKCHPGKFGGRGLK